ncbi:TIGR02391 family protein [Methanolacinia paynteri]|uniref:TIGR02391 family protein n=1 Tax=Methanolacinia paynteri TaxID=230356 RepID=UPI00064E8520|nr:TIGR02391 family protein [Methanolacinia paynteri]
MIDQYIELYSVLRDIREKSFDAYKKLRSGDLKSENTIHGYINKDLIKLTSILSENNIQINLGNLSRHAKFRTENDYEEILLTDISRVEEQLDKKLQKDKDTDKDDFINYLHPVIIQSSLALYQSGYYRNAVSDSITGLFDYIRKITGIKAEGSEDEGSKLIGKVFALKDPYLLLSDITTESGKSDQKGFMQIYQGAYTGIRNPKAHSLAHDLNREKAAQYLIFASLLARRIDEAKLVKRDE